MYLVVLHGLVKNCQWQNVHEVYREQTLHVFWSVVQNDWSLKFKLFYCLPLAVHVEVVKMTDESGHQTSSFKHTSN